MDLEVTDVPTIDCAGDTTYVDGEGCVQSCSVADIAKMSRETVPLICSSVDGTQYPADRAKVGRILETIWDPEVTFILSLTQVIVGGTCSADCPANTHPHPSYTTTCQADSKWSSPINCLKLCDGHVIKNGLITKDGSTSNETLLTYDCIHDSGDFEFGGNLLEGNLLIRH